jgi:hypothetical protein
MSIPLNPFNIYSAPRASAATPAYMSAPVGSSSYPSFPSSSPSLPAFDMGQSSLMPDTGLPQMLMQLLGMMQMLLSSLFGSSMPQSSSPEPGDSTDPSSGLPSGGSAPESTGGCSSPETPGGSVPPEEPSGSVPPGEPSGSVPTGSPEQPDGNSPAIAEQGADSSYVHGPGVQLNSNSNLPPIDASQWTARDGKNPGWEFSTPFVSNKVQNDGNGITTTIQGSSGGEARFNKPIGQGFYQFNVNPKQSSQVGELTSVFLYSNTGSDGSDKTQGFELDAEYNMVRPNSVTFGTWIDGTKYNEITVDAPKGDQTIGFNIQDGKTQIGFVSPDGSFKVVSETKDPRITKEIASHLVPMSNAWRFTNKGGTSQEGSSITINGFGRSDAPGQPVKPV